MTICPYYLDMYKKIRKIVKVPNNKSSKSNVKCKKLYSTKKKWEKNLVNNHLFITRENRILKNKILNFTKSKKLLEQEIDDKNNKIDELDYEIRRNEIISINKFDEYEDKISSMNQEFVEYNKELDYYREKYKEQEQFCDICWSTIMNEKEIFTCSNEKCKNKYHKSCCEKIRDNKCPFCRVELLKLPEIPKDLYDSEIDIDNVDIELVNVNEVVLHFD